jgi:hypothetical protein
MGNHDGWIFFAFVKTFGEIDESGHGNARAICVLEANLFVMVLVSVSLSFVQSSVRSMENTLSYQ